MPIIADTPRLTLGPFASSDVEALLAYRNDPEVARYQSWIHMTPTEAGHIIGQSGIAPGTPGSWSQLAVRLKPSGQLIGDIGLFVEAADPRLGEIGFTFDRDHQGRGLATEATAAALRLAFDILHLHRVKALVDCRNAPAIRLLERVGLRREGHFLQHTWFKGAWCDEYLYAVLHRDWAKSDFDGTRA
jgi:RimJ/RimL family protein N-acetyltransferase